jgi:hypothetical protein
MQYQPRLVHTLTLQIACVNSFLSMPSKGKSDQGTMQVWLQASDQGVAA